MAASFSAAILLTPRASA